MTLNWLNHIKDILLKFFIILKIHWKMESKWVMTPRIVDCWSLIPNDVEKNNTRKTISTKKSKILLEKGLNYKNLNLNFYYSIFSLIKIGY
jgi:hypothetical protein